MRSSGRRWAVWTASSPRHRLRSPLTLHLLRPRFEAGLFLGEQPVEFAYVALFMDIPSLDQLRLLLAEFISSLANTNVSDRSSASR